MNDDLLTEKKKNIDLQEGVEKLTIEVTHRDDLLSKVSESLKNKQFNDSMQNEDILKENSRLKLQLNNTEEVIEKVKKETEVLRHNDLMLKSKINDLTHHNQELKEISKNKSKDNQRERENDPHLEMTIHKLQEQNQQ